MHRYTLVGGAVIAALYTAAAAAQSAAHSNLEEIVVTATPLAEDRLSTAQPTSVLSGDALTLQTAPTIGETVGQQLGVHSTFYGAGASRPVIRGLGGDRVQVLTDGLATLDASGLSEDHAVAIDPALADQIEVIRGPATLLYGSGAAGGVVNVVTNRIHQQVPDKPEGVLEVRGDTALEERAAAGRFDAGFGQFALHLDGVWRETGDYSIPGFAESRRLRQEELAAGEEPDTTRGTLPNSWTDTRAGGIGVTYVGDVWLAGLAYSRYDTQYGIPGEDVFIDLVQDRVDLALRRSFANGSLLRLSAAANDYQHAEIEPGGEVGTLYEVDGRELRAAFDHDLGWGFAGTAGVQWQQVTLAAVGEEAFVPDTRTRSFGAFIFEQRDFSGWSLELGARVDRQEVDGGEVAGYDGTAVNLSLGLIRPLSDSLDLVAQFSRSERHPSSTELYADGPHAATGQFEIGNAAFDTERGLQVDVGLRGSIGVVSGELRAFVSRYDGYMYLSPTGAVEDELPVFQYLQQDARFHGVEASASLPLGTSGWSVGLSADAVRGRLDAGGDLPRIPPLRVGGQLIYERDGLRGEISARHSLKQDRVAADELPTDSYTLLGVELGWRPGGSQGSTFLFLRGSNLLDEDARVHSSPLKDSVPLPGRSLAAGVRFDFGR